MALLAGAWLPGLAVAPIAFTIGGGWGWYLRHHYRKHHKEIDHRKARLEAEYDAKHHHDDKRSLFGAPELENALFYLDGAHMVDSDLERLKGLKMTSLPAEEGERGFQEAGVIAGGVEHSWESSANITEWAVAIPGLRQGEMAFFVPGLEKPVHGLWTAFDEVDEVQEEVLEQMWILEGIVHMLEEAEKLETKDWAAKVKEAGRAVWTALLE